MPHKHSIRKNKQLKSLLYGDNSDLIEKSLFRAERENKVSKLSHQEKRDARSIIWQRYTSADDITEYEATKMEELNRLYFGEFEMGISREGQVFLNKARENFKQIYAYLLQLVAEVRPMIMCRPLGYTTMDHPEILHRKAKVSEALLNHQFDEVWNFRDDQFPVWLKHFLKYSTAIWKITYKEDNSRPDADLRVVDRALMRFDPYAKNDREAKWCTEDEFMPRSEVREMRDHGYWDISDEDIDKLPIANDTVHDSLLRYETKNRIFGDRIDLQQTTLDEDDLIQVTHYWQANRKGMDDLYAVIIGGVEDGELVRYGRNPFPYKGLPYITASYDPHESQIDGIGFLEEFMPLQRHINNLFELRNKDLQNNVYNRKIVPPEMLDDRAMQSWEDGDQLIPLAEDFYQRMMNDPSFDMRRYIFDLGVRPSTDGLIANDLAFALGQAKENSHVTDAFRGQAPSQRVTLGQHDDMMMKSQGVYRPVYLQIMRSIARVAEILHTYNRSLEFWSLDRVVSVIGENKYLDVLDNWYQIPNSNTSVRRIMPDELEVDISIDTLLGADAIATKERKNNQLSNFLQALGQFPDVMPMMMKEINMPKLFYQYIENNGMDVDGIKYSAEEKQMREQEEMQKEEQARQNELQFQEQLEQIKRKTVQENAQIEQQKQQGIQEGRASAEIQIDQNQAQLDLQRMQTELQIKFQQDMQRMQASFQAQLNQMLAKINEETKAKDYLMREEAKLEAINPGASLGHGNNINQ